MPSTKPVSVIMSVNPVVGNKFHNFSQVLRLFTEFPVHHLPIVDSKNKLIGIISSNDLSKVFLTLCNRANKIQMDLDAIDKEINITDIMTPAPVTISSNEPIAKAMEILSEKKFTSIPVVDNGELVGILSIKDVVAYLSMAMA